MMEELNVKIFHTGDWHIGKLIGNVYMTEDQAFVLEQLYDHIKREKPDVVIIAGDLYDRGIPPVEAIELLDNALRTIVRDCATPVISLAGNHDSNERIGFASGLLAGSGLYMSGSLSREIEPIVIADAYGSVHFYSIPFADVAVVRALFGDPSIKSHDDAMKAVLSSITSRIDSSVRNVCIAHGYVVKRGDELEMSDSERPLSIGGTESIDAVRFADFSYTALGHLHSPQKAGYDHVRYAGSLLKYSFSEVRQKKGITVVDMDGDGSVTTSFIELKPKRDVRIIKGDLKHLIAPETVKNANPDDYIQAILTDKGELIDPLASLRSVYPNILELKREERAAGEGGAVSDGIRNRSNTELFADFYDAMIGEKCPDEYLNGIKEIIAEAEREVLA